MSSAQTAKKTNPSYTLPINVPKIMCSSCEFNVKFAIQELCEIPEENIRVDHKKKMAFIKIPPNFKKSYWEIQHAIASHTEFSSSIAYQDKYKIKQQLIKAIVSLSIGIPLMLLCFAGFLPSVATLYGQIAWGIIGLCSLGNTLYSGRDSFRQAWTDLRHGKVQTPALISLSVITALCLSFAVVAVPTFFPPLARHLYFEVTFMLLGFKHLGDYFKNTALIKANSYSNKTRSEQTAKISNDFFKLFPDKACVVTNDLSSSAVKNIFSIRVGEKIIVKPGERIPLDGKIVRLENNQQGRYATIVSISNELFEGHSKPIRKRPNAMVYTGAINESRKPIIIQVTSTPTNSQLNKRIMNIEENNRHSPFQINTLANKINRYFIPVILGITLLTACAWFFLGPAPVLPYLISSTLSILAITCPCSMVIAPAIATRVGIKVADKNKIKMRNTSVIEKINATDTVVFDVNGTLTHEVADANIFYSISTNIKELLYHAACIEKNSSHPYAKAIVKQYKKSYDTPLKEMDVIEHDTGLECKTNGKHICIGQIDLLKNKGITLSAEQLQILKKIQSKAASPVFMSINGKIAAIFGINSTLRPEAKALVNKLKEEGKKIILASGADKATVTHIANQLGIENDPELLKQGMQNINYGMRVETSIRTIKTRFVKEEILSLAASLIASADEVNSDPCYRAVSLKHEKTQSTVLMPATQVTVTPSKIRGYVDGNSITIIKQKSSIYNSNLTIQINNRTVACIEMQPTKKQLVKQLQQTGKHVIMVGDAFNDAEVLADQSAVTVAMGHGDERCRKLADITLNDGLWGLYKSIEISNKVMTHTYWALGLSLTYNLIAIPMAAMAIFNPALAAAAMLTSCICISFVVTAIHWNKLTNNPAKTTSIDKKPPTLPKSSTRTLNELLSRAIASEKLHEESSLCDKSLAQLLSPNEIISDEYANIPSITQANKRTNQLETIPPIAIPSY